VVASILLATGTIFATYIAVQRTSPDNLGAECGEYLVKPKLPSPKPDNSTTQPDIFTISYFDDKEYLWGPLATFNVAKIYQLGGGITHITAHLTSSHSFSPTSFRIDEQEKTLAIIKPSNIDGEESPNGRYLLLGSDSTSALTIYDVKQDRVIKEVTSKNGEFWFDGGNGHNYQILAEWIGTEQVLVVELIQLQNPTIDIDASGMHHRYFDANNITSAISSAVLIQI